MSAVKLFFAIFTIAVFLSQGASAQSTGLLVQIRAACLIGNGSCRDAIRALREMPIFLAFTPAQRSLFVGTVAAEMRSVGVSIDQIEVDLDVAEALFDLADVAKADGDFTLADSLNMIADEIRTGRSLEAGEIATGSFSEN